MLLYSTPHSGSRQQAPQSFLHLHLLACLLACRSVPISHFSMSPRTRVPAKSANLLSAQLSSLNGRYLHPTLPASVYCICHSNLRVHHCYPLEIKREVYSVSSDLFPLLIRKQTHLAPEGEDLSLIVVDPLFRFISVDGSSALELSCHRPPLGEC